MNLLTPKDFFIFDLLTPEETVAFLAILKRYAEECKEGHDPEFINSITDTRLRAAFIIFNRRFEASRKEIESKPHQIESPRPQISADAQAEASSDNLSAAIAQSLTSFKKALPACCPWIATRYKPKNRDYNILRKHPDRVASLLRDLDASRFTGSIAPEIRRLLSA